MSDPRSSGPSIDVPGSSLRAFLVAYLVLGGGIALFIGGWFPNFAQPPVRGETLIGFLAFGLALAAFLSQVATFQVATLVRVSDGGVLVRWRGVFFGKYSRQFGWEDFDHLNSINRISGTVFLATKSSPLMSPIVTFRQAREVLRHPSCRIRDVPRLLR